MDTAQNISAEQVNSQTIFATFDLVDLDSAAQILADREFLRFISCLP